MVRHRRAHQVRITRAMVPTMAPARTMGAHIMAHLHLRTAQVATARLGLLWATRL